MRFQQQLELQRLQAEQEEKRSEKNKLLDPAKDLVNSIYVAERVGFF